jgi:hypothetical protein
MPGTEVASRCRLSTYDCRESVTACRASSSGTAGHRRNLPHPADRIGNGCRYGNSNSMRFAVIRLAPKLHTAYLAACATG